VCIGSMDVRAQARDGERGVLRRAERKAMS
jgi:hypothetical protein